MRSGGRISPHICHLVAPAPFGGLEAVVTMLAGGMAERGLTVRILALLGESEACDTFAGLSQRGVEVLEFRHPLRSYRAEVRAVARVLAEVPRTLLHAHGYHADLVGLLAARHSGSRTMSTAHGFTGGSLRNRGYEWLDRRALRRFDAVVAVSNSVAGRLIGSGIAADRVSVVPNGWAPRSQGGLGRTEARRILGLPQDIPVAGWVGRLSREKGPDVILEALPAVPHWHLGVIGSGPLGPSLVKKAASLGVAPRVHWLGPRMEASTLLPAFDALVVSSRTEGTPIIVLEGMDSGIPLVVTEVGGIPDMLSSELALLVPPESPERLAQALEIIRSDSVAARARAVAARRRLDESYSAETMLNRYQAIYHRLSG